MNPKKKKGVRGRELKINRLRTFTNIQIIIRFDTWFWLVMLVAISETETNSISYNESRPIEHGYRNNGNHNYDKKKASFLKTKPYKIYRN